MANIYHRYLDIPVDPNIDLFNRIEYDTAHYNHVKVEKEEINPDLIKWFKQFDVEIVWLEAFYTPPNGGKLPVHTDAGKLNDYVKINWTYGALDSKLIWWHPIDDKYIVVVKTVFGTEYLTIDEDKCTKLYETEITQPSLVNAGQFHSTYNPSTTGRWTLSLPLLEGPNKTNISWDNAVAKFERIIK
jgi:hypothetical protein